MIPKTLLAKIASGFHHWNPVTTDDFLKLFFQIEKCHWFYLDNYVKVASDEFEKPLKGMKINKFALLIFQSVENLHPHIPDLNRLLRVWTEYKETIPRFGAIILNKEKTKVVMVKCGKSWGFPQGKVEEGESHQQAAQREVLEEIGLDITHLIKPGGKNHLFRYVKKAPTKLYLVTGISDTREFKSKTKNEIKGIRWVDLDSLPSMDSEPGLRNKFFLAAKFVDPLRQWVTTNQSVKVN